MRRVRRRLFVGTYGLALLIGVSAGTAQAGNANGYRAGGNSDVSFDQVNLTTIFHNAFHSANATDVAPTDISTTLTHNAFSGEVSVMDASYQSIAFGWYECHDGDLIAGTYYCWQGHVHIDLYDPPGGSYSDLEARSLMCEEVGHSVGLAHSGEDASCMSQQWDRDNFSGHDDGVLNGIY